MTRVEDVAVPAITSVALCARLPVAFDLNDPQIPAFHLRRFCVICGQISLALPVH